MEKKTNMEAYDNLAHAYSKTQFIDFALSSMSETNMGTDAICGLAFIVKDIEEAMGAALNCRFYDYDQVPKVKVVNLKESLN